MTGMMREESDNSGNEKLVPAKPQSDRVPLCAQCGRPTVWIPNYERHYCYHCKKYAPKKYAPKEQPEKVKKKIGCPFFQDGRINWDEIKGRKNSRYPAGKIIDVLFGVGEIGKENWINNGKLRDKKIEKAIVERPIKDLDSYFWGICERIACRDCDHFVSLENRGKKLCNLHCDHHECRDCGSVDLCRRHHNPLNETMRIFRHSLINASPTTRRVMVLLALFYNQGEPQGGYSQTDIGRLAGTDRKRGKEKAEKLNEMGIIRKVSDDLPPGDAQRLNLTKQMLKEASCRRPRYTLDPYPNEDMRGVERSQAELVRNRSREVIDDLKEKVKKKKRFVEHEDFINLGGTDLFDSFSDLLGPRVIIGKVLPPECIVETIHSFEKLYHNLNMELIIPVARTGEVSEITEDLTKKDLTKDQVKERLMGRMEEFASGLIKIYDSMSAEDVRRLSEYMTLQSRSRGRNGSYTTLLYTF